MSPTTIAALAILGGGIIRLLKEDVSATPTIPARLRPYVSLAFGCIVGVVDALAMGTPWPKAILDGLTIGALPIAGHEAQSKLRAPEAATSPADDPRGTVRP